VEIPAIETETKVRRNAARIRVRVVSLLINVVRITAVMRGAVLYKLGLDLVTDRVMRRSYGIATNVPFRRGHHPESARYLDIDGTMRCRDVMHWYVHKVLNPI